MNYTSRAKSGTCGPVSGASGRHTLCPGVENNTTVEKLQRINGMGQSSALRAGQFIRLTGEPETPIAPQQVPHAANPIEAVV